MHKSRTIFKIITYSSRFMSNTSFFKYRDLISIGFSQSLSLIQPHFLNSKKKIISTILSTTHQNNNFIDFIGKVKHQNSILKLLNFTSIAQSYHLSSSKRQHLSWKIVCAHHQIKFSIDNNFPAPNKQVVLLMKYSTVSTKNACWTVTMSKMHTQFSPMENLLNVIAFQHINGQLRTTHVWASTIK